MVRNVHLCVHGVQPLRFLLADSVDGRFSLGIVLWALVLVRQIVSILLLAGKFRSGFCFRDCCAQL